MLNIMQQASVYFVALLEDTFRKKLGLNNPT